MAEIIFTDLEKQYLCQCKVHTIRFINHHSKNQKSQPMFLAYDIYGNFVGSFSITDDMYFGLKDMYYEKLPWGSVPGDEIDISPILYEDNYKTVYVCTVDIHADSLEELVQKYCEIVPDHGSCPLHTIRFNETYSLAYDCCVDLVKQHPDMVRNALNVQTKVVPVDQKSTSEADICKKEEH